MKYIKKLMNHLWWLKKQKVESMVYCGRPTSV